MSSGNVLDQPSPTGNGSSPSNQVHGNSANGSSNGSVNNMGHAFDNSMQMFAMKQQPMTSPVTGTVYSGPPAKYLNNGYANNRSMAPQQHQNRYGGSYNGNNNNNNNNNNGSIMQQRRQNNVGNDNAANDSMNARKVFVGGLSPDTKVEHLCEYFSQFGTVENATVKFDKSGRSKGFGFVLFEDHDSTDKVYSQDLHIIQGKRVDTKTAHRRDQALARKVFVGGLDTEVTDAELHEYFSQFGQISQIEAPVDKVKQKRRPFCFILFENEASAEAVLQQPHHTLAGKVIDCKRANPKTNENNQQNNNMNNALQAQLAYHNMSGLNQNPYQYQQRRFTFFARNLSLRGFLFRTTFTTSIITSTIAISTSCNGCSAATLPVLQVIRSSCVVVSN